MLKKVMNHFKTTLLSALLSVGISGILSAQTFAEFTFNNECFGTNNAFTSTSTSSQTIILEEWDFNGDGTYETTGHTVSNLYGAAGTYNVTLKVTTNNGYTAFATHAVTVYPSPTVDFSFNGTCLGDPTSFSANASVQSGQIASYNWEFNGDAQYDDATGAATSFTFVNSGYFNVSLKATSFLGCANTKTKVVTIAPKPVAAFEVQNVCDGESIALQNNSSIQGGSMTYTWNYGDGNMGTADNYLYASPGNYSISLTATSNMGCENSTARTVTIFKTPVAQFSAANVCQGEATTIMNTTQTNGAAMAYYSWNLGDGNTVINFNENTSYTYAAAGSYTISLLAVTNDGCRDNASISYEVYSNPDATISTNGATSFCIGNDVELSVNAAGNQVAWSTGDVSESITVSLSGTYEALVLTPNGCTDRDEITITSFDAPVVSAGEDRIINIGETYMLEASGAVSYSWDGPAIIAGQYSPAAEIMPTETTNMYTVNGTDANGCTSSDEVEIKVSRDYSLVPSNLMSPDGNGQNDNWYVKNITYYPECTVYIYDSWGKLIYTAKNYQNDFDGSFNNNPLPEGTYMYVIKCDGAQTDYQGTLNLVRFNR